MSQPPGIAAPYLLAMVVCDAVHRDPATGKHTLLGIFSSLACPGFPARHASFGVYAAVTENQATTPLRLVVADVDGSPIVQAEAPLPEADPRAVLEVSLTLNNVTFPAPGEYRLQLFAGGEFLGERRLALELAGKEQPQPPRLALG
jgi:hypothetical protein